MTKAEAARQKKEARMQAEIERVEQMRAFEAEIVRRAGGSGLICGIDEAGRGPLAGPVAAAAVILPEDLILPYLNDSKKVTEKRREALFLKIKEKALAWSVIMVPPERIDEINILQATYEAMRQAVSSLQVRPGVLVNDAVTIPGIDILQVPVIKGDAKCISVAAASILAKVTRDTYMKEMDALYPQYGFAGHKGYGTRAHCQAILDYGPSPIHRRSFLGKILAGKEDAVNQPGEPGDKPDFLFSGRVPSGRETGQRGEETAVRFLSDRGVRILERNFRDRDGEIDTPPRRSHLKNSALSAGLPDIICTKPGGERRYPCALMWSASPERKSAGSAMLSLVDKGRMTCTDNAADNAVQRTRA